MKIVTEQKVVPKLSPLGMVRFGSAFLFHGAPKEAEGCRYGSLSDPHILTSADSPARVVNLKNGNTFCVDFYKTSVEVLANAKVTL